MPEPLPVVPYGAWPSPVTAAALVEGAAAVGEVRADGEDVWWSEQRPTEGGRTQLVRRDPAGERHDLFPPLPAAGGDGPAWNARTAYLEYGGGAWAVWGGLVVFVNWADQRLYAVDGRAPGAPRPLTPVPEVARGWRWSEPVRLDDRWLVCARESHEPDAVLANGEAVNEVVAVPLDGSAVDDPARVRVLVSGPDFVHVPVVSGPHLAWLQWHHPRMPWDGSELVLATVDRDGDGDPVGIAGSRVVAGGSDESVIAPGFDRDGGLRWCTDRTGWWNPWRLAREDLDGGAPAAALSGRGEEVELGGPLWVGGQRWWADLGGGRLLAAVNHDGGYRLGVVEPDGRLVLPDSPFSEVQQVVAAGDAALVVAATPVSDAAPYRVVVDDAAGGPVLGFELLRPHRDLGIDPSWWSVPGHVSFPSAGGRTAHALHYPPTNPTVAAPDGERPPLVVMIHGGPTSAARNRFDLAKQFWTTRGFAVVDVNYGGSVGYGRPYRDLLQGRWGEVDVEDAVAAARHLADAGLVDPDRLAIRGGSAGGFTTLAALCAGDTFKAGASHYGVADLSALAADTHKFESRYLDGLVGPWPDARHTYEERSPIHHTDRLTAPLIVLHGSEDEVVPPNQAEMIVDALAERGVPHAYVRFEGEQHGFRRAEHIVRALEAELWFYGRVFGFEPADPVEPVEGAVGL